MLNLAEIERLDDEISKLQAKRNILLEEKRNEALIKARELIKSFEFSVAELGLSSAGAAKAKVDRKLRTPKYQNPADPNQTWGGGAKPKWIKEYEKDGGRLEDLLINKEKVKQ